MPVFGRWSRRFDVHIAAVGAAFSTPAILNAARFPAVCVGVMLPFFLLLAQPFTRRSG